MDTFGIAEQHGGFFVRQMHLSGGHTARSFKTREEADAELSRIMDGPRCRLCENPLLWDESYTGFEKRLQERLCHSCDHWINGLTKESTRSKAVVIDGSHYTIEPDLVGRPSHCAGHGGAKFVIAFADGRTVTTRNLWAQGQVPPHLREMYPDTATFARQPEHSGYVGHGSGNK